MFTVSLIAAPLTLNPDFVHTLCEAWDGMGVTHLSPDEASEFHLSHRPKDFEDQRAELLEQGIDLNLLPRGRRRKRLLLADMDSTMIEQECIDELAAEAGFGPQVAEITARAMNGELDFEDALRARVAMLRGLPVSVIRRVLADRITLMPGGRTLVQTMQHNGAHCALVSGGFTAFTADVARRLGFNDHQANHLEVSNGRLTGAVTPPILGRDAKVKALANHCAMLEIPQQDAIAVGDGANDLGMLGAAGLGVALHAKPAVAAECSIRIHNADLTSLLYLQGYAREDFVS